MTVTTLESLLSLSIAVTSPDGDEPVSIEFPKVNGVLSPEDALLIDCLVKRYRSANPDQALVTFETEDHWCLKVPRIKRVFSRPETTNG